MAFRPAYEIPEQWESNVPIDLVPAVKHIHETFEEADMKLRLLTEHMCYALLHLKQMDMDLIREYNSALTYVKGIIGPASTQKFVEIVNRKTPSATFKAFAYLYGEAMAVQARAAFSMLLAIGTSNEERLGTTAIEWASWHVKNMVMGVAFTSDFWVKQYCDKQDDNPDDDHDEMIYWTSWRAPRYLMMQPSLGMPYDASTAFERIDETTTREVLTRLHDDFVFRLDMALKHCVGEAEMEAAIKGPKPQPTSEGIRASPTARRDANKLKKRDLYDSWSKECRALKKRNPELSDARCSELIANMEIGTGHKPETIRKHIRI